MSIQFLIIIITTICMSFLLMKQDEDKKYKTALKYMVYGVLFSIIALIIVVSTGSFYELEFICWPYLIGCIISMPIFLFCVILEFLGLIGKGIAESIENRKYNKKRIIKKDEIKSENNKVNIEKKYTSYNDDIFNDYSENKEPQKPKVKLYDAIIESKKTGKVIDYSYGTYVKDGILYDENGKEVTDREEYFYDKENKYIYKHGYDEEYMEAKKEHKKAVDEYLKWKKENKKC